MVRVACSRRVPSRKSFSRISPGWVWCPMLGSHGLLPHSLLVVVLTVNLVGMARVEAVIGHPDGAPRCRGFDSYTDVLTEKGRRKAARAPVPRVLRPARIARRGRAAQPRGADELPFNTDPLA